MGDETQPRDTLTIRTSVVADFLSTLWGKILALLTTVTLLIGIYVEVITAWRGTNEGIKMQSDVFSAAMKAYQLPAMIARPTNTYGSYQYPEKLIPYMILCALQGKPLPVYGSTKT